MDCNYDTYFDAAPSPGSYLDTHWNIAGIENPFLATLPTKPPKAITGGTTSVKTGSAALEATVTPEADYSQYRFEYGTTTSYGSSTGNHGVLGYGATPSGISLEVDGLIPKTTYHYRVVAINDLGETAYGADKVFTTAAGPVATTGDATGVTPSDAGNKAVLSGVINPGGAATTYQFEWGKTTAYGSVAPLSPKSVGSGTAYLNVSEPITGLKGSTRYLYRLVAKNADGTTFGASREFTTPDWDPSASTSSPLLDPERSTEATLRGSVNGKGLSTTYQFEWGKTTSYGTKAPAAPKSIGSGTTNVSVAEALNGLKPNTVYHYRVVATNVEGTTYGENREFKTPDGTLVVETKPATEVLASRATLHGVVHAKGRPTTWGFLYGPTTEYGSETETGIIEEGNGVVKVSKTITGLKPGTTYHFQLVGLNEDGLVFGADETFTTAATAHRPRINAATYPATINASQEATSKLKLGFGALSAECATMTATSGSLGAATHELPLLATFGGSCSAFGYLSATINMNSCRFVLHAKNDGPPYAGSLEVACTKAGDGIVITGGTCEAKVGPQEGIEGIALANLGSGSTAEVKLSAASSGISYSVTKDGIGCPFSGTASHTNGSASGALKLSGVQSEKQVGVFVSGEEIDLNGFYMAGEKSAEEAKQPRFEAESYPAAVKGSQEASNKLKLGFGSSSAECGTLTTTSGSLAKATRELPLFASFGGTCTIFGFTGTVSMNSCRFVLRPLNEGPPYAGSLEVACTTSGDAIVIVGGTCEVKVAAQKGIGGIGLATLGKGDEREVRLSASSSAIPYSVTKDGIGCPLPGVGSYANGSLSGALRLSA